MTMTLIQHIELGSAQSSISFSSIPQTFTDLVLSVSARTTTDPSSSGITDGYVSFNGVSTNQSGRLLYGQGSGSGGSGSYSNLYFWLPSSGATANTFGSTQIYIPNYAGSTAKSTSQEIITENNGTFAYSMIFAGLWNSTAAITSVTLQLFTSPNFAQFSSATLYGILKGSSNGVTVS